MEFARIQNVSAGPDYRLSDIAAIMNVSDRTVRTMAIDGSLPGVYRARGQWRVRRAEFDHWRANGGST